MSQDKAHQDQPEFEKISPARVEITSSSPSGAASEKEKNRNLRRPVFIAVSLALLVIVALGVIFLLPGLIDKSTFTAKQEEDQNSVTASRPLLGSQIAPWEEAQQAKSRNQANSVLSSLLEKQTLLEDKQVQLWGDQAFSQANTLAQQGDEAYQQQDFTQALNLYQQSLASMDALIDQLDPIIKQTLAEGENALNNLDAKQSGQAFLRVLAIEPGHHEAKTGLDRARSLGEALILIEQANSRENEGQLDEARSLFQQALTVYPEIAAAKEGFQRTNALIEENQFNSEMSQGFNAIRQKDYSLAKAAFSRALKLKPGSREARDGLEQAELQITREKINQLKGLAEQQVQAENWQSALKSYEQILRQDNSLQFAQLGKQHAEARARLDQLLAERLAHPERLGSSGVFQETQALLDVAKNISAPGPLLTRQMTEIEGQLRLAIIPVILALQSDNLTEVTIKKVANLGKFTRREVVLKPGTYVLVGKRPGYRDVRLDITVRPGEGIDGNNGSKMAVRPPILVQCTEKI